MKTFCRDFLGYAFIILSVPPALASAGPLVENFEGVYAVDNVTKKDIITILSDGRDYIATRTQTSSFTSQSDLEISDSYYANQIRVDQLATLLWAEKRRLGI